MPMNRVQFQPGLSMPEFTKRYGTEAQCEAALVQSHWPTGFSCPACGHGGHCLLPSRSRMTFQCDACHRQTSLIAGTLPRLQLAPDDVVPSHLLDQPSQDRPVSLGLKATSGCSYPAAWLIHHKQMQAMAECEDRYRLSGAVQMDDAYLGGERSGGKAGRGSENKVPFVAAVSVDDEGHPGRVKLTPVPGFTTEAIIEWSKGHLSPGCSVRSDGLSCFAGASASGCVHIPTVDGERKPDELPEFRWVNTVLGNVKTSLSGAYHAFDFGKYATLFGRDRLSVQPPVPVENLARAPANGCGWRKILANQEQF